MNQPDNWVVLKVNSEEPHYRVLAGWSGGYTYGDSWRLNSGIVGVSFDGTFYEFEGYSESVYRCHKDSYGVRMNIAGVIRKYEDNHPGLVEVMPEGTDWMEMDWRI